MDFDFSSYDVSTAETVDIVLRELPPGADGQPIVLRCKPATESNAGYFDALLTEGAKRRATLDPGAGLDVAQLRASRDLQRSLFARHVVIDWPTAPVSKGKPVPFSRKACEAFLHAVPDWIFDKRLADRLTKDETFVAVGGPGKEIIAVLGED